MLGSSRIERWRGIRAPFLVARRGLPITPFPDRDDIVDDAVRTVAGLAEAKAVDAATSTAVDAYVECGGLIESYRARYDSLARRRRAQAWLDAVDARSARSRRRSDVLGELADEHWQTVRGIMVDEVSSHAVMGAAPFEGGFPGRDRRST